MTRFRFCFIVLSSCVMAMAWVAPVSAQTPTRTQAAVLTVKKMCCAKESGPAIQELSKVPGVGRVSADHKARTLTIEPGKGTLSPRAVWEAVERVKIEPLRLATSSEVFNEKPSR